MVDKDAVFVLFKIINKTISQFAPQFPPFCNNHKNIQVKTSRYTVPFRKMITIGEFVSRKGNHGGTYKHNISSETSVLLTENSREI